MMWWFLGLIALAWLVFGSVQDWRTREISDWLTLSLVVIGLGTRAIFALENRDFSIFSLALLSTVLFLSISFIFYYTKVFAGGDFKLLTGLGAFIPGRDFESVVYNSAFTVVLLLMIGFVYSFLMSCLVALRNKREFTKNFNKKRSSYKLIIPAVAFLILTSIIIQDRVVILLMSVIAVALLAYPYLLAVDACMIRKYSYKKLTPGDWIVQDVRVGNKTIKATVHGLTESEIALLKRHRKNVFVKEGIPFVPAFLFTFVIMVFVFSLQGESFFAELLAVA